MKLNAVWILNVLADTTRRMEKQKLCGPKQRLAELHCARHPTRACHNSAVLWYRRSSGTRMAPARAYRRGTAVHSLVNTDEHFACG